MPRLSTETYGSGDQSWLGTAHAIANARSVAIDPSTFTAATDYPDGYLRSGQPLAVSGGKTVKYDPAGTAGADVLVGHLLTDQKVVGPATINGPLYDHGRVKTSRVPGTFAAPAAAKLAATIIYV